MDVFKTSVIIIVSCLQFKFTCSQNLTCNYVEWGQTITGNSISSCSDISYEYISGFNRLAVGSPDTLDRIKFAHCCRVPVPYYESGYTVKYADWTGSMSQASRWSTCPTGYYLSGIYHSASSSPKLSNILRARCSKPNGHPYSYKRCIERDISSTFNSAGLSTCYNGYFITGLFRSDCDELKCITKLKCCTLESIPENFDSTDSVKNMVMDFTLQPLSFLAHYMGFSWCSGCRGAMVSEDFINTDDNTWAGDTQEPCDGYRPKERLRIKFDDWKFNIKDVSFGKINIVSMDPEVIDSGSFKNTGSSTSSHTVAREVRATQTVGHSTTSTYTFVQELGFNLQLGISGFDSKSSFEYGTVKEDSRDAENSNTFHIESTKELQPFSSCDWTLFQTKTKTSVPYRMSVQTKFSVSLTGFMRYDGGYYNKLTNYHYQYRGSDSRPTITYTFGNKDVTFYKDLKKQSTLNMLPWMWNDMTASHSWAQTYIDFLTDETLYSFNISDEFQEIEGKHVYFQWNCTGGDSRSKRSADELENDETVKYTDRKLISIKARSVVADDDVFADQPQLAILSGSQKVPFNIESPA